jgi:hypothetical protein
MKFFNPFVVFIACVVLSGCGDRFLKLPLKTSRLQSPEVSGKAFSPKLSGNVQTVTSIRVIQNTATRPPQQSPVEKDGSESTTGFDAGITLWPKLELFGSTAAGIYMTGLKYQLLGKPLEKSRKGNFSFALATAYGASKVDDSGSVSSINEINGVSTLQWTSSNKYRINDVAAIMGYRLIDIVLIYGGPFFSHYSIDGDFTQYHQEATTITPMRNRGNLYGANLAVQLFIPQARNLSFTYEFVYTRLDWSRMNKTEGEFNTTLALEYSF